LESIDDLRERIEGSGAGLHNNRARFIMEFSKDYWSDPDKYFKQGYETWKEYWLRLEKLINGLGPAKTAFGAELIYLHNADIVCLDTHMLQLYGYKTAAIGAGLRRADYDKILDHWVATCKDFGISPVTARWMWWDKKQNYSDPTYWSYVLER
jgi:hypothetical protein